MNLRKLLDTLMADLSAAADGREIASRAYLSRFHFDRLVRAATGEPPARLRRRLLLEQAAYALGRGASVTDVAYASGYGSPEAFTRAFSKAFGSPPSLFINTKRRHTLPAPNGVHFHPPCGLLLPGLDEKENAMDLTERLIEHDLCLTREMLDRASTLDDSALDRPITSSVEGIDDEPTIRLLLDRLVRNKEMWGASLNGEDYVETIDTTLAGLRQRWIGAVGPYLAATKRIASNNEWDTAFIDANTEALAAQRLRR